MKKGKKKSIGTQFYSDLIRDKFALINSKTKLGFTVFGFYGETKTGEPEEKTWIKGET